MSGRFLTLEDGDARLSRLLDGYGDDAQTRPVLISSLNPIGDARSEWTFEFFKLDEITRPGLGLTWLKALRPDTWVLSLAPLLATCGWLFTGHVVGGEIHAGLDIRLAVMAAVGVIALHAAILLFGDYNDYRRGWDRVRERGGARVIGQGWLRAGDVKRAAWSMFVFALLLGAAVLARHFSIGGFFALLVVMAAVEFVFGLTSQRFGLKYRGFAEILAWFLFGPMLTAGFFWANTGIFSFKSLALGSVFGSIALLALHAKNFERILVDGQARQMTWPVRTGFDASKTFTYFCVGLVMMSMAAVVVLVDPSPVRLLPCFVLAMGLGPFVTRVYRLKSPVAGSMRGLHRTVLILAWLNLVAFVVGDLVRL